MRTLLNRLKQPPRLYLAISAVFFIAMLATPLVSLYREVQVAAEAAEIALSFDGADDHVIIATDVYRGHDHTKGGTIECRLYRSGYQASVGIVSYSERRPLLYFGGDGNLQLHWDQASQMYSGTTPVPAEEWHHVVAAWTSDTWKVYVDGEKGIENTGLTFSGKASDTSTLIGAYDGKHFYGLIDFVRIYNRALSEEEIRGNMAGSVTTKGLVAWLAFDEGHGETALDSSPRHNDGAIHGATWYPPEQVLPWFDRWFRAIGTDEVAITFSALGFAFLSVGLPWGLANFLIARSDRFNRITARPYLRRLGTYFRENPPSMPVLIFIISLIVSATTYMYDPSLADKIVNYTFWFIVIGVLWQIIRLARSGEVSEQ